jgi:hypothetical protein
MDKRTRYRVGVKPSRSSSAVGAVVLVFFFIFGLGMLSESTKDSGFGGPPPIFVGFILFWLFAVFMGFIYHLKNATSDEVPPTNVVEYEIDSPNPLTPSQSVADQLRELEQLRRENLITQAEFEAKRREILNRL